MSKQSGAVKYRQYSPSKVAAAVSMVQNGAMSKKKAALMYGVPRTTLIDKLSGKAPIGSNPGKPSVLSKAEELVLVDYVKLMASIGYPLKRQELCLEVKKVLDHDGRKTPFKENMPGKHWYKLFFNRHPDLTERRAMALGHQRSHINFEMIEGWFNGLQSYLKQEVSDWEVLLQDPRRIFNADESGFPLSVTSGKVLTEKGVGHVYQVCTSNKTQITVLVCFNAMGNYVPPLIVYPGERFRDSGIHEFDEAIYGHTSSGWMDSELFVCFLHHLNDYVVEKRIPKPVMLLVDGHSTHMSFDAAHFCNANDIILYCLLENATHILQPCDVGFFSPMKAAWKKEVKSWQIDNLGQALTKKQFPGVFKKAWEKVAKLENAVHGFQKCGLYPLNPRNIDLSKLNPSKAITRVPEGADHNSDSSIQPAENSTDKAGASSRATTSSIISDTTNSQKDTAPDSADQNNDVLTPAADITTVPVVDSSITSVSCSSTANVSDSSIAHVSNSSTVHVADRCMSVIPDHSSAATAAGSSANTKTTGVSNVGSSSKHLVSKSFSLMLHVPEVKKKRSSATIRSKLPKALSGKEALRILQERENDKQAEELAKQKRKEERIFKKAQKLEEKEQKRNIREENKRKREQARLEKQALAQAKRHKTREVSSSESDTSNDENATNPMNSTDDDFDEERACPGCSSDEGSPDEWVKCKVCPRRWHITCTGDAVLFEIPAELVPNYPFHCELCV